MSLAAQRGDHDLDGLKTHLEQTIGFIGAGQMARALAAGFVRAGLVRGEQIVAADPVAAARDQLGSAVPQARIAAGNADVVGAADLVILAVKPQQIPAVLEEIGPHANGKLVVSIAAGVRLATLASRLSDARLIRVMPNTPCLIGQSASAFALGPKATDADAALVRQLLEAVGRAYRVDEKLLDAVTGLSGSGPAFVYVAIEALADGGVRMGLSRDIALALAAQTFKGSADMVLSTGEHPAVLKDRVASPGGTTIAGLQALESGGLRAALMGAVEAATNRSIELGND
jgi:pyrroline-5-carboxylate reductase